MRQPQRDPVKPGQESVWDYPRPPALEVSDEHVVVSFAGAMVADTRRAFRVLETSHAPTYYIPAADIDERLLVSAPGGSMCEWKGRASYFDVVVGDRRAARAAWTYRRPTGRFADLAGAVAFYPELVDACTVDGEVVRPVPGSFYGSWVTSRVAGPFKGAPGTEWW